MDAAIEASGSGVLPAQGRSHHALEHVRFEPRGQRIALEQVKHGRVVFDQTHAFFEKHGAKALIIGRFVPIVRTFITVVAGVSRMDRRHFFVWSAVGAVLWATGITLLGYFLGGVDFVHDNLEVAVLVIVGFSLLPMLYEFLRHRSATRTAIEEIDEVVEDVRDRKL